MDRRDEQNGIPSGEAMTRLADLLLDYAPLVRPVGLLASIAIMWSCRTTDWRERYLGDLAIGGKRQ
jgi:hypothetical protein